MTRSNQLAKAMGLAILAGLGSAQAQGATAGVAIANASFEAPAIPVTDFPAVPFADSWTLEGVFQNTGVFRNDPNFPGFLNNVDGTQAAFLGSEGGNGFSQALPAVFTAGSSYQLTVAVAASATFAPPAGAHVEIGLYYVDNGNRVLLGTVADRQVSAVGLLTHHFQDFSFNLAEVLSSDPWANQSIGVALIATGPIGGFFDLDNVRLTRTFRDDNGGGGNGIPEPASLAVLGVAALLAGLSRRRAGC